MQQLLEPVSNAVKRFRADIAGVAAIEFMFVAPMLLVLFLGMSEVSIAVATDRKLQNTSATISDLIGRETELDKAKLLEIFATSAATMYPYASDDMTVQAFGIRNAAAGKFQVTWSASSDQTPPTLRPADLATLKNLEGNFFVLTQTSMSFVPLSGVSALRYDLSGEAVSRVRRTNDLKCKDC